MCPGPAARYAGTVIPLQVPTFR